ncbi:hypothetical protein [Luteimonas sp. SDU101]|uniref:hypothetical protein n=1 Tax=Luteimonas sp. SDU101 TaxID=3422593 RepID=UPI003EC08DED
MSFEQLVDQIRASASPELIGKVIDSFPSTDDIEPWSHLDSLLWPDLPANDDSARLQLPQIIEQYQDDLDSLIHRYQRLRTEGLFALSNYDIGIAYRQVGPEAGLSQALLSVANHIARTRAQLAWLLEQQQRLTLPQLALF